MRTNSGMLPTALALAALAFLAGCAGSDGEASADTTASAAKSSSAETQEPSPTPTPEPEPPADLTGEWTQTNSNSEQEYQEATISGSTIEVYWISESGATKSLYWAGTYEAPTEPGPFQWDSQNDTAKTDSAMLASGDPTKTFAYNGEQISYDVTALGTTMTVTLSRK